MHNKAFIVGLALIIICAPAFSQTNEEQERGNQTSDIQDEKPEYTRRSLPADTFRPSEEISEDFPVPFPVDI
ncbi:MAG TPA: hypothetical protein DGR97_00585 [Gammaproteobacteria bacterium]|nr:hypothetical protein [Gammaproteobacteria bacterium]